MPSTPYRRHSARPAQLRLDVNFGDPVGPQDIEYPTLLGYPVEAVIAEQVETMISGSDANTRERSYADVLALSKFHSVETRRLRQALEQTAAHRGHAARVPLAQALDTLPTAR